MDYVIQHHGIKGQKWGVRRFQNEDGTLTPAGRKRYGEDLDIDDKSRRNIARIRKGEAYRRLDVAKSNNDTNKVRIAELQGRVRSAKRTEKLMKSVDKGAELAAKGQTISGNRRKAAAALIGSNVAAKYLNRYMKMTIGDMYATGRFKGAKGNAAYIIGALGPTAISAIGLGYAIKKGSDNNKLRAFQRANNSGMTSIKSVGSQEYADVVERRKKRQG